MGVYEQAYDSALKHWADRTLRSLVSAYTLRVRTDTEIWQAPIGLAA